jgi:hypothetical protein
VSRFQFDLGSAIIPAARELASDIRMKIVRQRSMAEIMKGADGLCLARVIEEIAHASLFTAVFDPDEQLSLDTAKARECASIVAAHGVDDRPLEFIPPRTQELSISSDRSDFRAKIAIPDPNGKFSDHIIGRCKEI